MIEASVETKELPGLQLEHVQAEDFEALFALRQQAMRESAQILGQIGEARIKQALAAQFAKEYGWHIVWFGTRIGWFAWQNKGDLIELTHLYILPAYQRLGIGTALMHLLCKHADLMSQKLEVSVLRGSRANSFYARFGFAVCGHSQWESYYQRQPYLRLHEENYEDQL